MDQCKGNFIVYVNGLVEEDHTDFRAASDAHFAKLAPGENGSFNAWDVHKDKNIEFVACLWEVEGGIKACVTDRDHNNVEFVGITIEDAVYLIKAARNLAAARKGKAT